MESELSNQMEGLLRQESKHYCCSQQQQQQQQNSSHYHDPMQVVTECANLVTDRAMCVPLKHVSSTASLRDIQEIQQDVSDIHNGKSMSYWRQQMFDWACMVVDSFGCDRESVAMSFLNLDRYISVEVARTNAPPITRDDYQLFAMVNLYIVIKVLEPYPRKLSIETLVDMSKNYYSKQVLMQTELDILQALQWNIHGPTALRFCRLMQDFFPRLKKYHVILLTLTEIAVSDGSFASYKASTVALACCLLTTTLQNVPDQDIRNRFSDIMKRSEFATVFANLQRLYF